jgi:hypothetical protein
METGRHSPFQVPSQCNLLQFFGALEGPSADHSSSNQRKEPFDLIQPETFGGRSGEHLNWSMPWCAGLHSIQPWP